MKIIFLILTVAYFSPLPALAQGAGDFGLNQTYLVPADNTRVAISRPVSLGRAGGGSGATAPRDDVKPRVKAHLDGAIAYCDAHMDDCNGPDGALRTFSQTIGNGRCNNRGYNCVRGVLEMCRAQLNGEEITPMYHMACAAMLGKLGERDCAENRGSCAGQLQGALYFSLRASAACHKSFEEDPGRQRGAKVQLDRFAAAVSRNVQGVYVGKIPAAHSTGHLLVWHTVQEAGVIATEKVLEFAFERLAMHAAGTAVSAASGPLLAFSGLMLFHHIAAAEMHEEVCLNWSSYYNGNYANVAASVQRMGASIQTR
jgi:hypothetical protein